MPYPQAQYHAIRSRLRSVPIPGSEIALLSLMPLDRKAESARLSETAHTIRRLHSRSPRRPKFLVLVLAVFSHDLASEDDSSQPRVDLWFPLLEVHYR
jgi:hypothetical protein